MTEPKRILYRGVPMIEGWPEKIMAAQRTLSYAQGRKADVSGSPTYHLLATAGCLYTDAASDDRKGESRRHDEACDVLCDNLGSARSAD